LRSGTRFPSEHHTAAWLVTTSFGDEPNQYDKSQATTDSLTSLIMSWF
jgi:hypothetical protein